MSDLRKAAQAALEALENLDGIDTETECVTICVGDEVDALRTALAEPEQSDPVGEVQVVWNDPSKATVFVAHGKRLEKGDLIYTHPPRREPLSDEQVGMLTVFPGLHHVETPLLAAFIRHIEQAITGEKT